jgi:hypothetical protein
MYAITITVSNITYSSRRREAVLPPASPLPERDELPVIGASPFWTAAIHRRFSYPYRPVLRPVFSLAQAFHACGNCALYPFPVTPVPRASCPT